jgi:hypothetical protein
MPIADLVSVFLRAQLVSDFEHEILVHVQLVSDFEHAIHAD